MNYLKIYSSLISKAKTRQLDGYKEIHHIIPKCLGGNNNKENLVCLTPEEHYLAHQLLHKMFPKNVKLLSAVVLMTGNKKSNDNRKTNKLYGWIRRKLSTFMSINQSGERNSQYGTICIRHELFGRKRVHGKFIEDYISQGWMVGGYKKAKQSSKKEVSNEEIEKFRKYYQIYSELGFDLFVKQTGYAYSKPNLVRRFAKLLPEFVPQNGKKRGTRLNH